jgi:acyl carrier protein
MLVDVIGPEYLIGLTIDLDTSFDADLELESLEFVALAERLLEYYGEAVDFVAWLATMELDDIIALTVGDLVTFIVTSTSTPDRYRFGLVHEGSESESASTATAR